MFMSATVHPTANAVMPEPAAAFRSGGYGDEGADLESALTPIAIRLLVAVREERRFVVRLPAPQELPVPSFVDLSGIGRCGPMRDTAGADHGDTLRYEIGRAAQRLAQRPGAMEGR